MKREAPAQPDPAGSSSEAGGQKATLTDVMLAFAAPLLELDAQAAKDPDVLSQLMVLVDMCWNLPILEVSDPAAHAKLKQGFDNVTKEVPAEIAQQLQRLLADRSARFGAVSFLVHTRVERDAAGNARIIPEARKPR